jgi:hypothetical protein
MDWILYGPWNGRVVQESDENSRFKTGPGAGLTTAGGRGPRTMSASLCSWTGKNFRNPVAQLWRTERLHDVGGDSCTQSFRNMGLIVLGRHHQKWQVPSRSKTPQRSKQIHTGHAWHVPIRKDQMKRIQPTTIQRGRVGALDQTPCSFSVFSLQYSPATQLIQHTADDVSHCRHVIHHKNLQIHHCSQSTTGSARMGTYRGQRS